MNAERLALVVDALESAWDLDGAEGVRAVLKELEETAGPEAVAEVLKCSKAAVYLRIHDSMRARDYGVGMLADRPSLDAIKKKVEEALKGTCAVVAVEAENSELRIHVRFDEPLDYVKVKITL